MRIEEDPKIRLSSLDDDPVLDRIQMSLGAAGGDLGVYSLAAGSTGGSQGADIMNQLVGLMAHGQRSSAGGATARGGQGSSAGPAVAAGVGGGLALGAAGGALLSQLGKKNNAAATAPIPGGGSATPAGGVPKVQIQTSASPTTAVAPVTTHGNNASGSATTVQTATQTPPPMPPPTPPPAVKTASQTPPPQTAPKSGGGTQKTMLPPLMGFENGKLIYKPLIPGFVTTTPPPKCDPNLASCPDPLASNLFSSTSNGTK